MASNNPAGIVKRGTNRQYADPRLIAEIPGFFPRVDMGDIPGLAREILDEYRKDPESGGLIHDLRVERRDDLAPALFGLVDGRRRHAAITLLLTEGIDGSGPIKFESGVPVKIEAKDATIIDKTVRMYKANSGKPFLPIEEARIFHAMHHGDPEKGVKGMTIAQMEEAVGKSDNYIVGSLALLSADPAVQAAVASGEVSAAVGRSIAVNMRGDKAAQAETVAEAKAAGTDKGRRRAVLTKIEEARVNKAAKRGKVVKNRNTMRALSDDDLSKVGVKVARHLDAKVRQAGWDVDVSDTKDINERIERWTVKVMADDALAAAFTLGALQGLKRAAGIKVTLDV